MRAQVDSSWKVDLHTRTALYYMPGVVHALDVRSAGAPASGHWHY